ncbi:MAG TPA: aldo/keto reductase [Gemmatimonadaceae bacterium]|nr:aldo/keto reductase [Gemmatimonadaceae bacterium]
MSRSKALQSLVEGRATAEGTQRFRQRFENEQIDHFFRPLSDGLVVSSLGLGTYLGECDDAEDSRYTATAIAALGKGVNLLDTAINYRCQRSERAIGEAVRVLTSRDDIERSEIVVCTKGGYIPLERTPPATKEGYRGFLDSEYYGPGVMQPDDVVSGGHCLTPRYLNDQIDRSRRNLGLAFIDVYYLHNPEQQLDVLTRQKFLGVIGAAFAMLEQQVEQGIIGCYGCSTWNGFRVPPEARNHLSLEELVNVAREVGGQSHHFKIIQLPINLGMTEAVRVPTQAVGGDRVSLLEAAHRLDIGVVGSATLMQSQLTRSLPEQLRSAFPGFNTDARRAIAFAQSLPLTTALVGMKSVAHLEQNLERATFS